MTVDATTFTDASSDTLADSGTFSTNGSTSSRASTTAPSKACTVTGQCTVPTDGTAYPVAITTAASTPTPSTIYSAAVGTGIGSVLIGGTTPVGWWISLPGNVLAGTYTSTVDLNVATGARLMGFRCAHRGAWLHRVGVAMPLAAVGLGTTFIGLAPPASAAGLAGPEWMVSGTAPGASGVSYTYTFTFTTATTSALDSGTMTVPAGTGGTPAARTVTPSSVGAGGSASLAGGTLTYTFTPTVIDAATAMSIEITGLTNTPATGSYTMRDYHQ